MNDLISREAVRMGRIPYDDDLTEYQRGWNDACDAIADNAPTIEPEQHEIGYSDCANAMLKMWIDKVVTDGEYNRIMDKLNAHWAERREG